MIEILFTICGRAGSKGIKNKNLKDFLDFPLSFYTTSIIDLFIKNNNQYDCDIALNTDSIELIELFKYRSNLLVEVVERRPELSGDNIPKVPVIRSSYEIMSARFKKEYNLVVDLDITSPLRTLNDLESLVQKKISSTADVVFSVTESRRNPYFNMVTKTVNGYERVINSNFGSRQEAPEIFDMNASMYAYSPEFLRSSKGLFDGQCDVIKMLDTAILDIDNENDFELMQVIARYLFDNNKDFGKIYENLSRVIIK